MNESQAQTIQNSGEQHYLFHSKEMKRWRAKWKKDQKKACPPTLK
jgi:hypothetical protein